MGISKKSLKFLIIALLLMAFSLTGCAGKYSSVQTPGFGDKYKDYSYCDVRFVKQSGQKSCGLACLASVVNCWGVSLTEDDLAKQIPNFQMKSGLTLKELSRLAKSNGLKAFIMMMSRYPEMELRDQIMKGRPIICALKMPKNRFGLPNILLLTKIRASLVPFLVSYKDHYVVVCGFAEGDKKVMIIDPSYGFATLPWKE